LAQGYFPAQYLGLSRAQYWLLGISGAVLLYVCVVLHELGHSLVARFFGVPVECVTLFIFGGVAQMQGGVKRPSMEFLVAAAGPLVSALLAGVCALGARHLWVQTETDLLIFALLNYLAIANMVLVLFNALPGFPLDGGRVLRSLLWAIRGDLPWATRVAGSVGLMVAVGLMVLGAWALYQRAWISGVWYLLIGRYLARAANRARAQALD
jgi:Zn-dependent protease